MIRAIRQQFDSECSAAAGPAVGERALLRAVLEDAVHCLAAETGSTEKRSRLAAEARAWVTDDDLQSPFSFPNLCDALGFNCETLRARLLAITPILLPLDTDGVAAIDVAGRSRRRGPAEQDVNEMIRAGYRLRTVAARFGISISKASILSAGLASRMKAERNQEIRGLKQQGWTNRAIGSRFGLSRARVRNICARRDPTDAERTAA